MACRYGLYLISQNSTNGVLAPVITTLGLDASCFEGFEPLPVPEGAEGSGYIGGLCAAPDGGLVFVESAFFSTPDGTEETSASSSDLQPGYAREERRILHILDAELAERAARDMTELLTNQRLLQYLHQLLQ